MSIYGQNIHQNQTQMVPDYIPAKNYKICRNTFSLPVITKISLSKKQCLNPSDCSFTHYDFINVIFA